MLNDPRDTSREFGAGVWYAIGAFTAWGVLPLYWKSLKEVPSPQILAHRILWSFVFVVILLKSRKRPPLGESFNSTGRMLYSLLSACILGTNWFIYIWAVNANHVVEASMGYFINPLISVLLGVLILRERLSFWQILSVLIALGGVSYITVRYGRLPWIALSLAFTFGFYGLLRKTSHVDSLNGLAFETAALSPAALAYLVVMGIEGKGSFGTASPLLHLLMIGSGVVTAVPLIWFAHGARRIPLSTVGFLQYLAPSLQLFLGAVVFGEPFTRVHLVSFSLIWGALCLYSLSHTSLLKRLEPRKLGL